MGLLDVKESIVSVKENNANTENAINNYSLGPINPSSLKNERPLGNNTVSCNC